LQFSQHLLQLPSRGLKNLSLLSGDFREHSDIDLAVSGLPREHIYKVQSKIEEIVGGMHFDLVYLKMLQHIW
jgi:predicted nucleotidyltransferase